MNVVTIDSAALKEQKEKALKNLQESKEFILITKKASSKDKKFEIEDEHYWANLDELIGALEILKSTIIFHGYIAERN